MVETKGPVATAGSRFIRLRSSGIVDPKREATITTEKSALLTVSVRAMSAPIK